MTCALLSTTDLIKKIEKKICFIGDRSRDLAITSKRSNHLSYHDAHTIIMRKFLFIVLEEVCEQEVNNFVYFLCKHINQRSITTKFHFDSINSFWFRGHVSARGKIIYCVQNFREMAMMIEFWNQQSFDLWFI